MSLHSRIKEARTRKGLTQTELGAIIGVAKTTIAGYERQYEPSAAQLGAIADALSVDITFLLQDEIKNRHETAATPDEMEQLVKKYRSLDSYGQEAVDGVLDVEYRRCEGERRDRAVKAALLHAQRVEMEAAEDITPEDIYTVPIYSMPMSAGTGHEAGQEYPEDFLLKKRPPRGTSYIARVNGDSMEPDYHDGDLVFVHATVDIPSGAIGVFFMDGKMWIKELGNGVLISRNPQYPPRRMTDDTRCQGIVLGVCDDSYFA